MKKNGSRLLLFFKRSLSVLYIAVIRTFKIIAYPQYLLFVIETLFCLAIIWYSYLEITQKIVSIWNVLRIIFISTCLCLVIDKTRVYKDVNYSGIFKVRKEKINNVESEGRFLKTRLRWLEENYQYYFLFLVVFFFLSSIFDPGDKDINEFGIIIGFIFVMCEIVLNVLALSPVLLILFTVGFTAFMELVGKEGALFDWTFLTLIFATTIGANFYDKLLVKNRFLKEITEENLIIRKTLYYIGIIFLYLWFLLTEFVLNSTSYTIFVIRASEEDSAMKILLSMLVKSSLATLLLYIYKGTRVKLLYLIFKYFFRDKASKNRGFLVPVSLEKGKWVVGKKDILCLNLNDLERISINTYRSKEDKNKYFVEKTSEIHKRIEYLNRRRGENSLGLVNYFTIFCIALVSGILLFIYYQDHELKIDDGMYKIVSKSGEAEVPNEIEVSGDAIVYKDKVEAYDKRTQSFEHGTISIRKKDKHSIELTKNVGDKTRVVYQKK